MKEQIKPELAITKDSLSKAGFRRYSFESMSISCQTDWNIIIVNFKNGHTEIQNANDSIVVHNCKSMDDVKDLVRLFLKGDNNG